MRSRYLAFLRPKLREARAVSLFFFEQTDTLTKKNSVENYWDKEKFLFFSEYTYIVDRGTKLFISNGGIIVRGTSWRLSNEIFRWTIYDDYFTVHNHTKRWKRINFISCDRRNKRKNKRKLKKIKKKIIFLFF